MTGIFCAYPLLLSSPYCNGCLPDQPDVTTCFGSLAKLLLFVAHAAPKASACQDPVPKNAAACLRAAKPFGGFCVAVF